MNKLITLLVTTFAILLGFNGAYAQDAGPTWTPSEIYACNFNGDANMDDLNAVIETWNEWMDDNGHNDYTALVMTPNFTAASFTYDFLWVGTWTSSAGLAGLGQYFAEAGDIQEDFVEVAACPSHQGFAMTTVKAFGGPGDDGVVPVQFTNCTLERGRIGPEAGAALLELTEYLTENGSDAGHFVMRPGVGLEADTDWSFKWVRAYSSYASLGHDFELFYNGGGAQMFDELTGRIMSCDSARIYNSRLVRAVPQDEE